MDKKPSCDNCKKIIKGQSHKIDVGSNLVNLCPECFNEIDSKIKKATTGENYLFAVILGIVFGFVGSLIWFGAAVLTKYKIGFVALGVGWLTALGIYYGSGKKKSKRLQIISIILSFVAIIFGEYLIANYYIVQNFIEKGYLTGFTLLSPIKIVPIVFEMIPTDPLTLLFWGIAIWFAYSFLRPFQIKKAIGFKQAEHN